MAIMIGTLGRYVISIELLFALTFLITVLTTSNGQSCSYSRTFDILYGVAVAEINLFFEYLLVFLNCILNLMVYGVPPIVTCLIVAG